MWHTTNELKKTHCSENDVDNLPVWPSGDDELEDILNAHKRKGFFENWPPSDSVSMYLHALFGYSKHFLQEIIEFSCAFSKPILHIISDFTFHTYGPDTVFTYVGDCICLTPFRSRVRSSTWFPVSEVEGLVFWYLSNIELRPSQCVEIIHTFHVQQWFFESDDYCILLAVFPKLLSMMDKPCHIQKQWLKNISGGRDSIVTFQQEGGFGKFGLYPATFSQFLHALQFCNVDFLDSSVTCRFVPWSIELQRRSKLFRLEQFQSDSYLSTFRMPVTKINWKCRYMWNRGKNCNLM